MTISNDDEFNLDLADIEVDPDKIPADWNPEEEEIDESEIRDEDVDADD